MKRSKTFLLITILFVFATYVFAQQTSYEIITHKDELFGKTIERSIVIGLDGKLWMQGTGEVSRLDGDTWTTFTLNDELSNRSIYPKAVSPDGVLWFSAAWPDKKIYRFDGETCMSFTLGHEGITICPNIVNIGPDGVVWAGGFSGAVFCFADSIWEKTIVDFALVNVLEVNDFVINHDGIVYAATNGGVYKYADGKWSNTYGPEGMERYDYGAHDANAVAIGPDGKVWVGTTYGEVSWYNGETWTKFLESTESQLMAQETKLRLFNIIHNENSYFSKNGEYVNFDFGENCEQVDWNYAQMYEEITGFEFSFQDSIATAREKVDVNGDDDTDDGFTFSVNEIGGILPGSDITWGTDGPSGYRINYMEFSSYKELWLAGAFSKLGIVLRYYDGKWIQYTTDDGLADNRVKLMIIAPDGVIWIKTETGISQFIPTPTIVETDVISPSEFAITGNYPNPFNLTTTIEFTIPETGFINLSIYNITGQKIRELVTDNMSAGTHSVTWDGRDENGMIVSSGIYMSRLVNGGHVAVRKMLLMK